MLKLHGFTASNYHNKVKLALLEKSITFEEVVTYPSRDEALLDRSPMGKLPFLETEHGSLCESQVILDYLEDRYAEPPLYPRDAYARAKCRELCSVLDLHLELVVRRLYPAAFFGGTVSEETKLAVRPLLDRGLDALRRIARFAPYIGGAEFSYADCTAYCHLPLVGQASKLVYGVDLLAEKLPAARDYLDLIKQRPHAQRVNAERKVGMEEFLAYRARKK